MKACGVDKTTQRETLSFETDLGASRSIWIAGALVVVIVAWMGSGLVFPSDTTEPVARRGEPQPVSVAVRRSTAETVTELFQAEGQALPDRDSALRAETSGTIDEVYVVKGQMVEQGAVVARFDRTESNAALTRAREDLVQARRELENAQTLFERGVATTDRLVLARVALAAAESRLTNAREAVVDAGIKAPFTGRIEALDLDPGEFVSAGTEVGRIVDNSPLTVTIQVPQQSLTRLHEGQTATVRFITGEVREGKVIFVGTAASAETRTFLAEVRVQNLDGAIPAGISAEVEIPSGETVAHFLSPSIISLNADGELGVKTVGADNVVRFHHIALARSQLDGIWVTGLPDTADIITVGQGFVRDGETVRPSAEEPGQ
ncbi:efflux RND transporter periplasmic adaptor subunit [Tropicimonas sp. IMCC6043]|uniref:efflux RND transporter periplasmic adaptor subunit n=1 Tax=Tropicimonas sp. IMCC6043 TaxID=2510645 RepID=UPI00101CAB1A|nr:efflux RND transporter periplasmic adaptor subunit [Tropicimonas sp. IMCC6043]RYH08278.1 efflux RND transporter periplasmic adaptor subunit [Tropicimonas sp. IMCC6043]